MPVDLLDFMGLYMDNHKMSNQTPLGFRYSWIFSLGSCAAFFRHSISPHPQ